MSEATWSDALDALETLLARQRSYVEGRGPLPDSPWEAPTVPLPPSVRARALQLVAQCEEIELELTRMLRSRPDPAAPSPYR